MLSVVRFWNAMVFIFSSELLRVSLSWISSDLMDLDCCGERGLYAASFLRIFSRILDNEMGSCWMVVSFKAVILDCRSVVMK